KEHHLDQIKQCLQDMERSVPITLLGHVMDTDQMEVIVQGEDSRTSCQMAWSVNALADRWHNSLAQHLDIKSQT
ncbi:MAG: hypothetical protein OEZ05_13945, partial [Nitrospirota bacterium]|nr:hypothetical protein [Nitrospirota bacterium]